MADLAKTMSSPVFTMPTLFRPKAAALLGRLRGQRLGRAAAVSQGTVRTREARSWMELLFLPILVRRGADV